MNVSSLVRNVKLEEKYLGCTLEKVFINGELIDVDYLADDGASYGIFLHSLILSTEIEGYSEGSFKDSKRFDILAIEYYRNAVKKYINKSGFDAKLITSMVPKISDIDIVNDFFASQFELNGVARIVSYGPMPELLGRCSQVISRTGFQKLTRRMRKKIINAYEDMNKQGMSVFALAIKDIEDNGNKNIQEEADFFRGYVLIALLGFK